MYNLEIKFKNVCENKAEEIVDEIQGLLAVLRKNGQILDTDCPIVELQGKQLGVHVLTYEETSLELENCNTYVKNAFDRLKELNVDEIAVESLGKYPASSDACDCKKINSYILFTHFLSIESPLSCGDCFASIPLYKIPHLEGGEYLDILSWQSNYKACDSLQMGCKVGEKFATKQMSKLNSSLNRQGLKLCKRIYKKTSIPTYYYLYRPNCSSSSKELKRKCPSCSKKWLLENSWHRIFDFKCDNCFLLSNIAWGLK